MIRETVRIGLVGCGRMGAAHLRAAAAVREAAITAVADPRFDSEAPGLHLPVMDTEGLLGSSWIDAVLVASPTHTHATVVRAALESDKDVLCEKPLTLDPDEDASLGELAAERGRVLQVGFWRRFAEPYLRLRDVLASAAIGIATSARLAQWDAQAPPPGFHDPTISGGIEVDCGVHEFDLIRWLFGDEVEAVAACAPISPGPREMQDVETVTGLARLTGGRTVTIDLTRTAAYRDSIRSEIIASEGAAIVDFTDTGVIAIRSGEDLNTLPLTSPDVIQGALQSQLRVFVSSVAGGGLFGDAANPDDSGRALVAAQALRDARISGEWLKVDSPGRGSLEAPDPADRRPAA